MNLKKITNCPVLVNTSFNVFIIPINNIDQRRSQLFVQLMMHLIVLWEQILDILVIEDFILFKNQSRSSH